MPGLIASIIKTILYEVLPAIVHGVIDAIKDIAMAIKDLFTGSFNPSSMIDPTAISEVMKHAAQTLTGEAGKLFKVMDLTEGPVKDKAMDAIKAVENAGKKARNWLLEAWKWILDRLKEFLAFLTQVWRWVWDHVLEPLIMGLREVWLWVYDNIVGPIVDGLREVWGWVYDKILQPFFDALKVVWDTLIQALQMVWDGIVDLLQSAWDRLKDIWSGLVTFFSQAVDSLREVFDNGKNGLMAVGDYFSGVWDKAKAIFGPIIDGFSNAFSSGGGTLTAAANVFSGVTSVFSGIVSAFNGIVSFFKKEIVDPLANGFGWINTMYDTVTHLFQAPGWLQSFIDAISKLLNFGGFGSITGGGGGGSFIDQASSFISGIGHSRGGMIYAAAGQMVPMLPRGTDTVPAMLTPGEYVVNRGAVQSLGVDAMHAINAGQMPVNQDNSVYNINVKIDAKTAPDEKFVRATLIPLMKEELRRASLDGQRVIYKGGIRS
jgi:hypothetical protein